MSFALGQPPYRSRIEKKRYLIAQAKLKKAAKDKAERSKLSARARIRELLHARKYPPCSRRPFIVRNPHSWLIIPAHPAVAQIISKGKSICSILQHLCLQKKKAPIFPATPFSALFNTASVFNPVPMFPACLAAVKKNQRVLRAFRALALRWLAKRIRPSNDTDLVTCEPIAKPITIMCWDERHSYNFEPSTIRRDMCERLMMVVFGVAATQPPRNPYTNMTLTDAQFYSVMGQLRAAGHTHWILEGYASNNCCMKKFKAQFDEAIEKENTVRQFNTPTAPDTLELILDFIEDEHYIHDRPCNRDLYEWAITNRRELPRIKRWIALCKKKTVEGMIPVLASRALCRIPTELIAARGS